MKTPLITRKGYLQLKQELDTLWRVERPETTRKVTWAASLGDRSENADYQYNKKKLREIDRRVRYLRKCLENLKVVDYDTVNNSTKLSYDVSGSYFTLNTSLLEEDYQYEIRFKSYYDSFSKEFAEKFRFRVIKDSE